MRFGFRVQGSRFKVQGCGGGFATHISCGEAAAIIPNPEV